MSQELVRYERPSVARPSALVRNGDGHIDKQRTLVRLLPSVRRQVMRMLGPYGCVDDAVQEALIAIARALDQFEERASLETYAHRITTRACLRFVGRRGRAGLALDEAAVASLSPTPEQALLDQRALQRLHHALDRLPKRRRVAFVLCGLEGLKPNEAAEIANTSPGAMRARYMHARREIARMLGLSLGEASEGEEGKS